jgi:hypothetical protein
MRFHPLFVLFIFAIRSLCSLATPFASPWDDVHSKHTWNSVPEDWQNLGYPAADTTVDLHVALKAQGESTLIDALYEVSSPGHPKCVLSTSLQRTQSDAVVPTHMYRCSMADMANTYPKSR